MWCHICSEERKSNNMSTGVKQNVHTTGSTLTRYDIAALQETTTSRGYKPYINKTTKT